MFKKYKYTLLLPLLVFLISVTAVAQPRMKEQWADSVMNSLTPDERIAQLLMIRAYSNRDEKYYIELTALIREKNIGGVCFFQGGPVRQAIVTNRLQNAVKTPLFVALDAEWGPGMRLDSVINFPKQMTLGAITDSSLIYDMGTEIARQLKRLGVHINFAPVADINNNPLNPVINARSFGEGRVNVARKSYWYMKGMQDQGIIAVAKHFPGHGDTGNDSHYTLPLIDKPRSVIDTLELFPFSYLIDRGLKGMMIAHLRVPSIDTAARSISSLSKPVITGLLREKMGFAGMVITDGMDMKGLTDFANPAMAEVMALDAGNDILLLPVDARKALANIRKAIDSGLISQQMIDEKCRRVLQWKYESGLAGNNRIRLDNLTGDLNSTFARLNAAGANTAAITLVSDPDRMIPLRHLDTLKIATLAIGDLKQTPFQSRLADYAPVDHFNMSKDPSVKERDSVMRLLEPYNLVIAGFVQTSDLPQKNFGIGRQGAWFIDSLAVRKKVILSIFTSPYSLASFNRIEKMASVLIAYQDNAMMQELTAQAIFGGSAISGKLPVAATALWPAGSGLLQPEVTRVAFSQPEAAGVSSDKLREIDSIVTESIRDNAFPGAQVVVIRRGQVIYRKAFGSQVYNSGVPLCNDDLYDLASLSKILATTLTAMKLAGDGLLDPDRRLSRYYPELRHSDKNHLIIREILAHQAKLQPFIPFWKSVMEKDSLKSELFGRHFSIEYTHRVADAIYLRDDYPSVIVDSIIRSPLLPKTEFKYSDLGFILLGKAFEEITQQPFSSYVQRQFYNKLGLRTMGFHPRDRFSISRIAPTELDKVFRKQLVHGDVHDQTAALLGGVAGHAGLFSDALDVAIVMQMLLRDGTYGGDTLLEAAVIRDFTGVQFAIDKNRRGAGFDKPALIKGDSSPACASASPRSFGHSGFTGTYAWADPDQDLVYVFLSNRVYPDASNSKITRLNIRTRIHEAIYKAITD